MQYLAWMGNQEGGDGSASLLNDSEEAAQGSSVEQQVCLMPSPRCALHFRLSVAGLQARQMWRGQRRAVLPVEHDR